MQRKLLLCLLAVGCLLTNGCWLVDKFVKKSVSIPQVLPADTAELAQLLAEINRVAAARSVKSKLYLEFEDLSDAGAGIAEKYKRADGSVYVQRPGQIYLAIQGPLSTKIAEMTSDGEVFCVAVYQGAERYRRYVCGRNNSDYSKLQLDEMESGQTSDKMMQRDKQRVGVFSKIRPQHFVDGLLLKPIATTQAANQIYVRSETKEEEPDNRLNAKQSARVMRGYYLLDEITTNGDGTGRVSRRFWFDRYQGIHLARVQLFSTEGAMTTDITYSENKPVGASGVPMPNRIAIRRPKENYGLILTYQEPANVTLDKQFDAEIFVLRNNGLPEVDLEKLLSRKPKE